MIYTWKKDLKSNNEITDMVIRMFLLCLLQTMFWESHQSSSSNENKDPGEMWSNQTDVEVVNGTQLLNMLQSCSGCLVTIKSDPQDENGKNISGRTTLLKSYNTTVHNSLGFYISNQTKESLGNESAQNESPSSDNELGDMLRKCQGCYVDNKKKSHTHTKIKKEKKRVKDTSTKDYESKTEDRYIQPPETPENPGNIPYGESELPATNEVPPLDNTTSKSKAADNPTDEQLGTYTEMGDREAPKVEVKKRKSRCKRSDVSCILGIVSSKSKWANRRKSYHVYNDTSDTSGEKRAPTNVEKSDENMHNNSLSYADGEQKRNITDELNIKNIKSGNPFGEVDEIRDFAKSSTSEVQPAELKHMIERNDVRLIDLREEWELSHEGTISKAINIPLNSLGLALRSTDTKFARKYGIPKPKTDDCKLVFFDQSGGARAAIADKYAKKRGFQCTRSLKGGFDLWKNWVANNEHLLL